MRRKIIDLLRSSGTILKTAGDSATSLLRLADHLISNGVTVQHWYSVTEKLPEDDLPHNSKSKQIKVLVAYMSNGNWVVRTNLRKKSQWYRNPDEWGWSVSDPITHWMPLPDPPREDA